MTKLPSPKKLTPFHIRNKDLEKETATLFIRIHTRKIDSNEIVPRYDCMTSHTARRTDITNICLSYKYTILQMMHISNHKMQKTFMNYIKLSSKEIAYKIVAMSKKESKIW